MNNFSKILPLEKFLLASQLQIRPRIGGGEHHAEHDCKHFWRTFSGTKELADLGRRSSSFVKLTFIQTLEVLLQTKNLLETKNSIN